MSFAIEGALLPSILVSLMVAGVLAALLRSNTLHAVAGITLFAWVNLFFLAETAVRSGRAEGLIGAAVLVFTVGIYACVGLLLGFWQGGKTNSIELDS